MNRNSQMLAASRAAAIVSNQQVSLATDRQTGKTRSVMAQNRIPTYESAWTSSGPDADLNVSIKYNGVVFTDVVSSAEIAALQTVNHHQRPSEAKIKAYLQVRVMHILRTKMGYVPLNQQNSGRRYTRAEIRNINKLRAKEVARDSAKVQEK